MSNPTKIYARVTSVRQYGAGVYKVCFAADVRFPRFRPGQFLHLTVDDFDPSKGYWPESRVFSIASRPGSDEIAILYSVKGVYTKRMEGYLEPGARAWLKFPYGDFIVDKSVQERKDVVLIAGGTGVSPFIPFLEANNEAGWTSGTRVNLAYGLRSAGQLVFHEVYAEALKHAPAFSMSLFLEENGEVPSWFNGRIVKGMLSVPAIMDGLPSAGNRVYFLSGPPAMIRKFADQLRHSGVQSDDIKIDEW